MKPSREIIKRLRKAGWKLKIVSGDHWHFEHPDKPGKVTVPHPVKDIGIELIKAIEKQAGMKLR